MKKLIFALLVSLCFMSACKNNDAVNPTVDPTDIKASIITGQWTIASFRQKVEDKTAAFSGYAFVFAANGTVTATKSGSATNGTWAYSPAQPSYYGAPPAAATFTLNMSGSSSFTKLSKSWDVNKSATATDMKLDNKEPLEDEHLEFVK